MKYCGIRCTFDQRAMTLTFPNLELVLKVQYEVCQACEGSGTTSSHIEPDGGGFTSSEWAEACDGDSDFAEDYLSGAYDRDCDECDGKRVVPVPIGDIPQELKADIQAESDYRQE